MVAQRRAEEAGASAVEYGLFLGLIAAVIVGIVTTLGLDVVGLYQTVEG